MTAVAPASVAAIDLMLARARARLRRIGPQAAASAVDRGAALLVDIRPVALRQACGEIPHAIVVDRNTLEWRLDPTSPHRIPQITDAHQTIILVCDEGYASSLAAVTLQDLGLVNATDLVGGFRAWHAAGLPVLHVREPADLL